MDNRVHITTFEVNSVEGIAKSAHMVKPSGNMAYSLYWDGAVNGSNLVVSTGRLDSHGKHSHQEEMVFEMPSHEDACALFEQDARLMVRDGYQMIQPRRNPSVWGGGKSEQLGPGHRLMTGDTYRRESAILEVNLPGLRNPRVIMIAKSNDFANPDKSHWYASYYPKDSSLYYTGLSSWTLDSRFAQQPHFVSRKITDFEDKQRQPSGSEWQTKADREFLTDLGLYPAKIDVREMMQKKSYVPAYSFMGEVSSSKYFPYSGSPMWKEAWNWMIEQPNVRRNPTADVHPYPIPILASPADNKIMTLVDFDLPSKANDYSGMLYYKCESTGNTHPITAQENAGLELVDIDINDGYESVMYYKEASRRNPHGNVHCHSCYTDVFELDYCQACGVCDECCGCDDDSRRNPGIELPAGGMSYFDTDQEMIRIPWGPEATKSNGDWVRAISGNGCFWDYENGVPIVEWWMPVGEETAKRTMRWWNKTYTTKMETFPYPNRKTGAPSYRLVMVFDDRAELDRLKKAYAYLSKNTASNIYGRDGLSRNPRGCYPCPKCGTMMYETTHSLGMGSSASTGSHCSCWKCGANFMTQELMERNPMMYSTEIKAIAVIAPNDNGVNGEVVFTQDGSMLHIDYNITGLSDGEHGFHIHEYGDLTDGCESACAHFNPYGMEHGGPDSEIKHLGDLGNITSSNNLAKGSMTVEYISLVGGKVNCIVGRMIIVHADRDDLGTGGNAESLKTGNAGKRVGCGVIGLMPSEAEEQRMYEEDKYPLVERNPKKSGCGCGGKTRKNGEGCGCGAYPASRRNPTADSMYDYDDMYDYSDADATPYRNPARKNYCAAMRRPQKTPEQIAKERDDARAGKIKKAEGNIKICTMCGLAAEAKCDNCKFGLCYDCLNSQDHKCPVCEETVDYNNLEWIGMRKNPALMMEDPTIHLEYHDDKANSHKYWEGQVLGSSAIIQWGRVPGYGRDGTTQEKTYRMSSAEAANQFILSKAYDKRRKGYMPVM